MTSRGASVSQRACFQLPNRNRRAIPWALARCFVLVSIFWLNACGATDGIDPAITVKPGFLPVKFIITQSGVSVAGDRTLVTPWGLVSIGAKINLPPKDDDKIRVIIRDRNRAEIGLDDIYDVKVGSGSFEAVTNGKTAIQITGRREVIIDVTDARIERIEFRRIPPASQERSKEDPSRWSKHWQTLPFGYHAWSLTSWAYDDSTMSKWYGVGFAIFLLRLAVATLLAIVDLLLVVIFFFAAIFYLFSETARNVFYGFLVIFILCITWVIVRDSLRSGGRARPW